MGIFKQRRLLKDPRTHMLASAVYAIHLNESADTSDPTFTPGVAATLMEMAEKADTEVREFIYPLRKES